jgi:hypothetical protein
MPVTCITNILLVFAITTFVEAYNYGAAQCYLLLLPLC